EDATDPSTALFTSPDAIAGATEDFTIDPLDKGDYYFHCQYHPTMSGTVSAD
ncbi:MAG: copper-binding protein, partial [Actinobacteria bacterium]|nr:copper-binding protein [Actinomycetota bacterium]